MMDEAFTLEKLGAALARLADMPPPPMLASSALFSDDHALRWSRGGRDYVAAGPGFWSRIPLSSESPQRNPLFEDRIVDLDHPANRRARAVVFESMAHTVYPPHA